MLGVEVDECVQSQYNVVVLSWREDDTRTWSKPHDRTCLSASCFDFLPLDGMLYVFALTRDTFEERSPVQSNTEMDTARA